MMHLREIGLAVALVIGLLGAVEIGIRLGARRRGKGEQADQLGTVQGAVLGLLALLLGFSFSGAMSRFIDRQDLILREANAVGTAYLRSDLLPEPQRGELRGALRAYTDARIELFEDEVRSTPSAAIRERLSELQKRMWTAAMNGVESRPAVMIGVLPPINEVIDLLAVRHLAAGRHLPPLVFGLLAACAAIALTTIGYGSGLAGRRHSGTASVLALLVATSLWVTIDLDYPRMGLVQMNADPFLTLRGSFAPVGK